MLACLVLFFSIVPITFIALTVFTQHELDFQGFKLLVLTGKSDKIFLVDAKGNCLSSLMSCCEVEWQLIEIQSGLSVSDLDCQLTCTTHCTKTDHCWSDSHMFPVFFTLTEKKKENRNGSSRF